MKKVIEKRDRRRNGEGVMSGKKIKSLRSDGNNEDPGEE